MRPDVGDLLRGIKKSLGEVIFPSLTEPFVVEQAMFVMLALEHVTARWDKAQAFFQAEHLDLRQLLAHATAQPWAASQGQPDLHALLEEIRRRLDEQSVADREARTPEAIAQANAALRGLLGRLLESLEREADKLHGAGEVLLAAHAYMKRQVEREREWVRVGEFTW